jgi:hypothetical protein
MIAAANYSIIMLDSNVIGDANFLSDASKAGANHTARKKWRKEHASYFTS